MLDQSANVLERRFVHDKDEAEAFENDLEVIDDAKLALLHTPDSIQTKPAEPPSKLAHYASKGCFLLLISITLYSIPIEDTGKSVQYVWWCGWITAITTGLGAVPFYYVPQVDKFWLGVSNGLAAGMMLAATVCLCLEAVNIPQANTYPVPAEYRLLVGTFFGWMFIKTTKVFLEDYEDLKVCGMEGMNAQKALLIMAVMTCHSISEGIGVGVSFGGEGGFRRGHAVTMTMAAHNIPEGVAISLALIPRGMSTFYAMLWCVFSSIPQPIFAVPSFIFIENFLPILPAGLGFAGGAMALVAFQELIPESLEDTKSLSITAAATAAAFAVFISIQFVLSYAV